MEGPALTPKSILLFKLNQCRRIPKRKRNPMNWREHDASSRQRRGLTAWFTAKAAQAWRAEPRDPGRAALVPAPGDPVYVDAQALRSALGRTKGLTGPVTHLLKLTLAAPDHAIPCRWAERGRRHARGRQARVGRPIPVRIVRPQAGLEFLVRTTRLRQGVLPEAEADRGFFDKRGGSSAWPPP